VKPYKVGDNLPWWEGSDAEEDWTSSRVSDDREKDNPTADKARVLSQVPFRNKPKLKRKLKQQRTRYDNRMNEDENEEDSAAESEEEEDVPKESEGGGQGVCERFGAFSLTSGAMDQLPKLCLADLPLLEGPEKRGGSSGLGKLGKLFFDLTLPAAAVELLIEKVSRVVCCI